MNEEQIDFGIMAIKPGVVIVNGRIHIRGGSLRSGRHTTEAAQTEPPDCCGSSPDPAISQSAGL